MDDDVIILLEISDHEVVCLGVPRESSLRPATLTQYEDGPGIGVPRVHPGDLLKPCLVQIILKKFVDRECSFLCCFSCHVTPQLRA